MTNKNKCCKKLCVDCELYKHKPRGMLDLFEEHLCKATIKTEVNCVSGKTEETFGSCEELNADGNCPFYKDKKAKIRPLIKAIEKFLADQEQDYFRRDIVNSFLAKELLSVLKGNKSNIVEGMYDDESPMDYTIIATKEFIERSLCSRHSANEEGHDNDDIGKVYITEVNDE